MLKRFLQALLALTVLAGVSGLARADLIYTLTTNNIGPPGNFGTVDLHFVDGTHATLQFTAASGYFFGDGGAVAVNVNATAWSLSNLFANSISGSLADEGSGNEDGFGSFNQKLTTGSFGANDRATMISFELTNTSGSWADETAVLTNNASGYQVGAHFLVCLPGTDCVLTGFAVNGGPPVRQEGPEPGTLSLLGIALLALGTIAARKRKS